MKPQTLVTQKKYLGKYVALKSLKDNKVVASGKKPIEVVRRANKKGISAPVIIFVPESSMTHIY